MQKLTLFGVMPHILFFFEKGVTASVAKGMTTSRPRGVPTRKELGLRIAQSSVTAQSQLVGNLRPRQDRRNQVSPWLPRDPRETQTAGQGDRRTSQAITRKTQRLCQGTGPPPSRDPTAGGSRKVHVYCIGPWEQSPL